MRKTTILSLTGIALSGAVALIAHQLQLMKHIIIIQTVIETNIQVLIQFKHKFKL